MEGSFRDVQIMRPIAGLFVATALVGFNGCRSLSPHRDEFHPSDLRMPLNEKLRMEVSAPIVVLGRVVEVQEVGPPTRSTVEPRLGIQLNRIKIAVETVIKGDVREDVIEFSYFAFSPAASEAVVKPTYSPQIGQRRLYFLRPSANGYRSVRDVLDYTLRVGSGSHDRYFCEGISPGCCITRILLVPQEDMNVDWFVSDLYGAWYVAEVLCSRQTARELYQRLTEHSDKRVANAAREVMAGTGLASK